MFNSKDPKFNDKMEMMTSFCQALQEAGGCIKRWKDIKNMTLEEMIDILAQNHIVFTFEKPD